MKTRTGLIIPPLDTAAGNGAPLYVQVYRRIRELILSGAVPAGQKLPSARSLASDIAASRTTVEAAYAQLWAEGFVVRRVGSGTYVAALQARSDGAPARRRSAITPAPPAKLARRGRVLDQAGQGTAPSLPLWFSSCVPPRDLFPGATWRRLAARWSRRMGRETLSPTPTTGLQPLRETIAAHLAAARGVCCDWRQVIILSSTQQALDLTARLLLDEGDRVCLEEPGYLGARAAFLGAGARLVPVPVDQDGLDVSAAVTRGPEARLVYVTPSHQFPLRVTLSLPRRLALLEWARRASAWIFEDDYDSELRYSGHPLAALHGLDRCGRVLYAGSFNKMLFAGLRLAFLVVPDALVEPFGHALAATSGSPPGQTQGILADFLAQGHFAAHLRRLRQLYGERRDALCRAVGRHLPGRVRLAPADTGIHTLAWLPGRADDRTVSRRAAEAGMDLPPLSRYYLGKAPAPGLLVTYAGEPSERIAEGVRRLARLLP